MKILKLAMFSLVSLLLFTSLYSTYTPKVEVRNAFGDIFVDSKDIRMQYLDEARKYYFKDQTDTLKSLGYYYSGEEELDQELNAKYARITAPLKDAESQSLENSDLRNRLPSLVEYVNNRHSIYHLRTQKNEIPFYYEWVHYQTQEELDLIKWAEETGGDYCLEGDAPVMRIKVAPHNRKFPWYNKYFLKGELAATEISQEEIDYSYLMEYLCQNRTKINYYGLYKWNKKLFHTVLDKQTYDYQYKSIVDKLLLTASNIYECDVERTLSIMHATAEVMIEQEKKLFKVTEGMPIFNTPFHDYSLLQALKPYTNGKHLQYFYSYVEEDQLAADNYMGFVQSDREWESNSEFVWCYSFWLRRYFEGNDHNIYNTLRAIQKNYESMK